MARTALLLLAVASIACGPTVTASDGGDSDSAENGSSPAPSTGAEDDASSNGDVDSGMLPPCEPWSLEVAIDDRESEPITDISFKEGSFVGTGLPITFELRRAR